MIFLLDYLLITPIQSLFEDQMPKQTKTLLVSLLSVFTFMYVIICFPCGYLMVVERFMVVAVGSTYVPRVYPLVRRFPRTQFTSCILSGIWQSIPTSSSDSATEVSVSSKCCLFSIAYLPVVPPSRWMHTHSTHSLLSLSLSLLPNGCPFHPGATLGTKAQTGCLQYEAVELIYCLSFSLVLSRYRPLYRYLLTALHSRTYTPRWAIDCPETLPKVADGYKTSPYGTTILFCFP